MKFRALLSTFSASLLVAGSLPLLAQNPTVTRPDSLQDGGYGWFMANSSSSVISGGVISGKVVIQGTPLLWQPLTVTITCANGRIAGTVRTNATGDFSITKVNEPKIYSMGGNLTQQIAQHYEDCSLTAPLAGYHATSVVLMEKYLRDTSYLPNIVLTVDEQAPGSYFSSTTNSASPAALRYFQKAHDAFLHRNPASAKGLLEKAVRKDPQFAEAWYLLGRLQIGDSIPTAEASFKKAHQIDPRFLPPCTWLAAIYYEQHNWPETAKWAAAALKLYPAGTARIWYYSAQADFHMGRNEAARSAAQKAMAMDPEHDAAPNAEPLLALTLADKGDYAGAIQHLRNSLVYIQEKAGADLIKRQIAYMQQQQAVRGK
jgi:Tfp pilus assembly protein PilF